MADPPNAPVTTGDVIGVSDTATQPRRKLTREVSAGLLKSGLETGGGSEAVGLGHPMVPVRDGFVGRFVPLNR